MRTMTDRTAYPPLHLFVAGEWVPATARQTQIVVNPATDETLGALPMATAADLDQALSAAAEGFRLWRATPVTERAAVLHRAAAILRERIEADAVALTLEQGKPLAQARVELASGLP